jgi:hypothetical protein
MHAFHLLPLERALHYRTFQGWNTNKKVRALLGRFADCCHHVGGHLHQYRGFALADHGTGAGILLALALALAWLRRGD